MVKNLNQLAQEIIKKIVNYIVDESTRLKNSYTNQINTPVEFVCIFSKNGKEYKELISVIEKLGKVAQDTPTGYTYLLDEPLGTKAGLLRLVKIRRPDPKRNERGDADFNTNYAEFKKTYQPNPQFELIGRGSFEMLRLSDPKFDVMACFSSVPMSKGLGIKLWP